MGACELAISPLFDTTNLPKNNDELADQITLLAGRINAAEFQFLKLIAEFDRREAWGGAGIRSCAHWLNWKYPKHSLRSSGQALRNSSGSRT